jgi:hypothetical protein
VSHTAKSLICFAAYLIVLSLILIAVPDWLFQLFGLPATHEVWVRLIGMLLLFFAFFYIQAARQEIAEVARWSVYVRVSVPCFFGTFVVLGLAQPLLMLFGMVDLFGALWTALALWADHGWPGKDAGS